MLNPERPCSIQGCGKLAKARDLCAAHYYRWRKNGDPNIVLKSMPRTGAVREFLENIPRTGCGCFMWPFSTNGVGYGLVQHKGRRVLVTRVLCEREHGPPPSPRHHAAHSCGCGHKGCCAPWHLSWKSPAENTADMIAHGTQSRGERHPTTKLTEANVRMIRKLGRWGNQADIAKAFGISQTAVSKIIRRKIWAHLP